MPPGFDLCKAAPELQIPGRQQDKQRTGARGTLNLQVTPRSPACMSSSPPGILPRTPRLLPKPPHPQTDRFQARSPTPRAAPGGQSPNVGHFPVYPSPTCCTSHHQRKELSPTSSRPTPNVACDAARIPNSLCSGSRHCEGGGRICKETWFLAAGKHKPRGLATVWGRSSVPGWARLPCRSSGQRFVSGRWKSRQIRPFPNPSQQDRQCSGERSHRPCPCVFKQGHILLPRTPPQTPFPVLHQLAGWLGWGERGTQGSSTWRCITAIAQTGTSLLGKAQRWRDSGWMREGMEREPREPRPR